MTPIQHAPTAATPILLRGAELLAQLHRAPMFASLALDSLACLDAVEQVEFAAGSLIERQGDDPRYFWVLLSGSINVMRTGNKGLEHLATLPAGTGFGELPLMASMQNPTDLYAAEACTLLRLGEEQFWKLMTSCTLVRKAILGNMAYRLQKMQSTIMQQEKMASLGTLAAGLMHELNNPGTAAKRASAQLRENLMRLHELSARFTRTDLSDSQKECLLHLQTHVLQTAPVQLNSLEQSDAEEALATWMESAKIENAWKIAPTLVTVGIDAGELECTRASFAGTIFSDALNWLDALVSSMQLVVTIEESIGRVATLASAVKSYAYEGKGQQQTISITDSLFATLVILGHKIREKRIVLEKTLDRNLPPIESTCSGLNQVWTNLLDNAIDAVPEEGRIRIKTWGETRPDGVTDLCVSIADNGAGVPLEHQAHIFDPFYTTKPVGVGSGLGLGIVHRIVEQFGGTIRFSSDATGTTFLVRLPSRRAVTA